MSEVVAAVSWQAALVPGGRCRFERDAVGVSPKWWCNVKQSRVMKVEAQMVNPSTCSSRISIDIPLHEIPGASFDQYLEDKPRVFEAICPDKLRSHQINEEEWRVEMIPIQFLFLTASPVVDMRLRLRSSGIGYPPQVPPDISKVLDLEITRWELEGLDEMLEPSQLCLSVKGGSLSRQTWTTDQPQGPTADEHRLCPASYACIASSTNPTRRCRDSFKEAGGEYEE